VHQQSERLSLKQDCYSEVINVAQNKTN